MWSTSGGHLEFGESVEQCAKRELLEETGLEATSLILGPWTNDMMDGDKHSVSLFGINSDHFFISQKIKFRMRVRRILAIIEVTMGK
jgi:8-oxo-dGTP pyrophosphatase MutT (NUDIX family)